MTKHNEIREAPQPVKVKTALGITKELNSTSYFKRFQRNFMLALMKTAVITATIARYFQS